MGQNLGQRSTQTVTHTPIGHNGADRMGRRFMGTHPLSSVRNTTLCWRGGIPDRILSRCGSFSESRRKRRGRNKSRVRRDVGEGVLFVLPSSCSTAPPFGEVGSLQQMVGGTQWSRQERSGIPSPFLSFSASDLPTFPGR